MVDTGRSCGRCFFIPENQKECKRSRTASISHIGVEVAPQMPTRSFGENHPACTSSGRLTKKVPSFTALQTSYKTFPLEDFIPDTKTILSNAAANCRNCCKLEWKKS